MKLFLTSQIEATAIEKGAHFTGKIDNRHGFLTRFRDCISKHERMLYISYTPGFSDKVLDWFENTIDSLKGEEISFNEYILINGSNAIRLRDLVPGTDVIFLSGGHLPTQNCFFQQIGLRDILSNFDGTIVAQSAGSMNCAKTVYVCPELPGESIDPNFERFRPGLGLTDINIIPHYNVNANFFLDGKRFYWDIIYPDTFKVPLYVLTDGSYFYVHDDKTEFYGEVYLFEHGVFEQISGFAEDEI